MADDKRKDERKEMKASPATLSEPGSRTRADAERQTGWEQKAEDTAEDHRRIQAEAERRSHATEKKQQKEGGGEDESVQTGGREHPGLPYPAQHQDKPGIEAELDPRPQYMAPGYKGSEKLQDMATLITGGDSGIGRAVAVLFAREGADVAIVYLNEHEDAEETKRAVEGEGGRCILIPGDVTSSAFCRQAVERTVKEFGKLDVLVNNAAFQEHVASLEDLTDEHFDRTLKTNLYGYFYMAKAAMPHLRRGGSIINSGSVTGMVGNQNLLDYSMTKGGIHAFTMALAQNVADKGIRVNAVAPGPVWTPLNPADQDAEKIKKFGGDTLLKRPAQPEELSPAYVFLASPVCSSYITGEILPVLGGRAGG
ncbi:MAG: short-chain dehydrogenase [Gemmatimonadetes bacterium]|nr:short-chain dehydrogenase [Gemmatimonadota bacterium]